MTDRSRVAARGGADGWVPAPRPSRTTRESAQREPDASAGADPGFAGRVYVTGLLSRTTRSATVGIGRRLADLGLTFAEYLVLVRLWRASPEPLSQTELVSDLAIERSSLSTLLVTLENHQLAYRTSDPRDGRRLLVHLDRRGRELERPVLEVIEAYERSLLGGLDDATIENLRAALEVLQERARVLRKADGNLAGAKGQRGAGSVRGRAEA